MKEQAGEPLNDAFARTLEDKSLLLVVDNFEHVLDAAAQLCEPLLRSPRLRCS